MMDILFENEKEKNATERVLAAFKVKALNSTIDDLITEILKYATEIDKLLGDNNFEKRYLSRVSTISENHEITLDEDLFNVDFRIKELIEDYIKRINTRITLIKESDESLKHIENQYNLDDINLEEEIKVAKLREEDFA